MLYKGGRMSESSGDGDELSWISWFTSLPGHSWLVEVDASFIEDAFNLYGLKYEVDYNFKECIDAILGKAPDDTNEHRRSTLYPRLREVYGLIHARFLTTSRGLSMMAEKLESKDFGHCPRSLCAGAPVLPLGLSNTPGEDYVKLFCTRCQDVFDCPPCRSSCYVHDPPAFYRDTGSSDSTNSSDVAAHDSASMSVKRRIQNRRPRRDSVECEQDGAFFGTTFPHLLLVVKPQMLLTGSSSAYVPRIFGFRVHNQRGRASCAAGDARSAPAAEPAATAATSTAAPTDPLLHTFRKNGKPLTTPYANGVRPVEDDFVSTSEEDNPGAPNAKRPRIDGRKS